MKKTNHGHMSLSDITLLRVVLEQMSGESLGDVIPVAELIRERKKAADARYPREGRRVRRGSPLFV